MPTKKLKGPGAGQRYTLDARPDRIDYRDREYRPLLESLPAEHPSTEFVERHFGNYVSGLILDQGQEGACTGFGLAAVVNYLRWKRRIDRGEDTADLRSASPRMLYHLARVYDEWAGEDYEGSSCRGAMKGWHKHGVCDVAFWPYQDRLGRVRYLRPKLRWQEDAARRPLGAYYRIDKDSIVDMQAAIYEVGAIYVSSMVHDGWFVEPADELPVIGPRTGEDGGHAYALVGYTDLGFIVQNSWGEGWGFNGFAVLPYDEWIESGTDAWVSVLGAPLRVRREWRGISGHSLADVAAGKAEWSWRSESTGPAHVYRNAEAEPLEEGEAFEYTVVLGNEGRPLNRLLDVRTPAEAVTEVVYRNASAALERLRGAPKLAIYAHGGLNDEAASIRRVRVMAPYFRANGIHPLFVTWRTGALESIEGMLADALGRSSLTGPRARGLFDVIEDTWEAAKNRVKEAKDRSIEVAARNLLVRSIWMEMKQNAAAAAGAGGGLVQVARELRRLKQAHPQLELHLVGHSAGSILLGHLFDLLGRGRKLRVKGLHLYAPACTVAFALDHYGRAVKGRVLRKDAIHVHDMDDERERADSVWKYGKSLLYLVSRALEDVHKTPILGMARAWEADSADEATDLWNAATREDVRKWARFAGPIRLTLYGKEREQVSDGRGLIPLAHGSFDNDVEVVGETLRTIRGRKLRVEVENLRGF